MEFNIITLDMVFTLGIQQFSGVAIRDGMIEQFKCVDNIVQFWDSGEDGWMKYNSVVTWREHLVKHYHTFFTWELVNNEI